ncbi:hypothetical protein B0H11DRAFT_2229524 [Mycena galericulata]|nr:hypothetical protein B0H11DRAFT_2229524 [Mycena galericulata]
MSTSRSSCADPDAAETSTSMCVSALEGGNRDGTTFADAREAGAATAVPAPSSARAPDAHVAQAQHVSHLPRRARAHMVLVPEQPLDLPGGGLDLEDAKMLSPMGTDRSDTSKRQVEDEDVELAATALLGLYLGHTHSFSLSLTKEIAIVLLRLEFLATFMNIILSSSHTRLLTWTVFNANTRSIIPPTLYTNLNGRRLFTQTVWLLHSFRPSLPSVLGNPSRKLPSSPVSNLYGMGGGNGSNGLKALNAGWQVLGSTTPSSKRNAFMSSLASLDGGDMQSNVGEVWNASRSASGMWDDNALKKDFSSRSQLNVPSRGNGSGMLAGFLRPELSVAGTVGALKSLCIIGSTASPVTGASDLTSMWYARKEIEFCADLVRFSMLDYERVDIGRTSRELRRRGKRPLEQVPVNPETSSWSPARCWRVIRAVDARVIHFDTHFDTSNVETNPTARRILPQLENQLLLGFLLSKFQFPLAPGLWSVPLSYETPPGGYLPRAPPVSFQQVVYDKSRYIIY